MKKLAFLAAIGIAAASPSLAQMQPGGGWWGGNPGWNMWNGAPGQGWGGGPGGGMMPGQTWNQGWGMGPGGGMMPGWGAGPAGPGQGMMTGARIDADQDGAVSAEEAAAHAEEMFAMMDADGDGALVADEFGAGRMGMMRPFNPMRSDVMQERHAARFAARDGDGDGKVTMAEFLGAEKAQYDGADADGDGKVTPWELRARMWE